MNVPITFDIRVGQFEGVTQNADGSLSRKDVAAGAAWWIHHLGDHENRISHLRFSCPCGCGDLITVPVYQNKNLEGDYGWKWDGNKELPTLSPSIQKLNGCKWHGHLTKGIFDQA